MHSGIGECNGTFGELIQGILNERLFLVTLPVKTFKSEAIFTSSEENVGVIGPLSKCKAIKACELFLKQLGIKEGGNLWIESNIPVGKGMASSSADIVAALRAAAHCYSLPLSKDLISRIAGEIEPTDGVMYEEVVAYDYVNGKLIEDFGSLPEFVLIGIDTGGTVETVEFNRCPKYYSKHDRIMFQQAYEFVKLGVKTNDLPLLFQAATISAEINQKILPKPYFNELKQFAEVNNAGLVVAHSGTLIGILTNSNILKDSEFFKKTLREIHLLTNNSQLRVISFSKKGLSRANLDT